MYLNYINQSAITCALHNHYMTEFYCMIWCFYYMPINRILHGRMMRTLEINATYFVTWFYMKPQVIAKYLHKIMSYYSKLHDNYMRLYQVLKCLCKILVISLSLEITRFYMPVTLLPIFMGSLSLHEKKT
jgi:hypothetical protein